MNGPEHYLRAEELVEAARAYAANAGQIHGAVGIASPVDVPTAVRLALAEAQVHATLAAAAELPAEPADPVTYLLWSGKHDAWWGPDQRGYTAELERAGRYDRAEALDCVVRSAQCGVREQVTSMVAAPENWSRADG